MLKFKTKIYFKDKKYFKIAIYTIHTHKKVKFAIKKGIFYFKTYKIDITKL